MLFDARLESTLRDLLLENSNALRWVAPEQWLQAELFSRLDTASTGKNWKIFDCELPVVTASPVRLPKATRRNWQTQGAVKWVDLCLHDAATNEWLWIELKVRRYVSDNQYENALAWAIDALAKDHVALAGIDPVRTAALWKAPDEYTKAYWFNRILHPHADSLSGGRHRLIALLLLINLAGPEQQPVPLDQVRERIRSWRAYRKVGEVPGEVAEPVEVRSERTGRFEIVTCRSRLL